MNKIEEKNTTSSNIPIPNKEKKRSMKLYFVKQLN
jgi:hypothetical protein